MSESINQMTSLTGGNPLGTSGPYEYAAMKGMVALTKPESAHMIILTDPATAHRAYAKAWELACREKVEILHNGGVLCAGCSNWWVK